MPGPNPAGAEKRLRKEFDKLKPGDLDPEWELGPVKKAGGKEDNLFEWRAVIPGPEGSPYEDGRFEVKITFNNEYPFKPPKLTFKTKMYHPNISNDGGICLDILQAQWSPALSIHKVLQSLSSLLTEPNFSDPLNGEAAGQWKKSKDAYNKKCREIVAKHGLKRLKPAMKRKSGASSSKDEPAKKKRKTGGS